MHIILTENELKSLSSCKLPTNSTLVVKDKSGDLLRRLVVTKGGEISLDVDFKEQARKFKNKKEETEFLKKLDSKKAIIEYFISSHDDCPQREYNAAINKERDLLSYISHSGTYTTYKNKHLNIYRVSLSNRANIAKAEKEVKLLLFIYRARFGNIAKLPIDIMEDTLSEYGVYRAEFNLRNNSSKIYKTTYGMDELLTKCTSITEMLQWIKGNASYD